MIVTDILIGYGAPLPVAVIDSSEGRKNGLTKIEKAHKRRHAQVPVLVLQNIVCDHGADDAGRQSNKHHP